MIKTFKFAGKVTISVYTTVEAETLEDALEIANEKALMDITHTGGATEETEWMADELDGEVFDIHEE